MFVGFFEIGCFFGVKIVSKKEKAKSSKQKWVLTVVCLSFGLSVVMSFVTSMFVESAGLLVALLSLIVLVLLGGMLIALAVSGSAREIVKRKTFI